jgi:hypothetical protein
MTEIRHNPENLYYKVVKLLKQAQSNVVQSVNKTMVLTYFEIGRMIVEEEQKGKDRAEYGQQLIHELSNRLSTEFDKGFSPTNIKQMRSFYLIYSKSQTVSDEFNLSWSHYLKLMRIKDENERRFYEKSAKRLFRLVSFIIVILRFLRFFRASLKKTASREILSVLKLTTCW